MTVAESKELLKQIYASVEKLVPTNRTLINFVNSKAIGEGMKRSLYKVKFIDKAEISTKQLAGVTLMQFKKHLGELNLSEEETSALLEEATVILEDAKKQVEKVYGEVRRYVVTSELRAGCVKDNFRKIPNMSEQQNEAISKEIFSLALEEINKGDHNTIDDIEVEFKKINNIALTLFNIVATTSENAEREKDKRHQSKKSNGLLDRFFG